MTPINRPISRRYAALCGLVAAVMLSACGESQKPPAPPTFGCVIVIISEHDANHSRVPSSDALFIAIIKSGLRVCLYMAATVFWRSGNRLCVTITAITLSEAIFCITFRKYLFQTQSMPSLLLGPYCNSDNLPIVLQNAYFPQFSRLPTRICDTTRRFSVAE